MNELIDIKPCERFDSDNLLSTRSTINCHQFFFKLSPNSTIGHQGEYTVNIDNQHLGALLDELKYAKRVVYEYDIN